WIVMELVRGVSPADLLDAEGPSTRRSGARAHRRAEVLAALRAAHDAGVLHRDVKPANVLMSNDGRVVLTDFGIAMVEGSSALTMTGEVIGSPEFLAPERALGRTPGPESDLWALGVLLYAAVEGSSPFRQNTPLSTRCGRSSTRSCRRRGWRGRSPRSSRGCCARTRPSGCPPSRRSRTCGWSRRAVRLARVPRRRRRTHRRWRGTRRDSFSQSKSRTPPQPVQGFGPPPTSYSTPTAADEPHRNRRAAVAIIAGVIALALAIGGLTYAC
ncbi:serine/threonine-protein kinase, partial [Streptomyces sp. L7]